MYTCTCVVCCITPSMRRRASTRLYARMTILQSRITLAGSTSNKLTRASLSTVRHSERFADALGMRVGVEVGVMGEAGVGVEVMLMGDG